MRVLHVVETMSGGIARHVFDLIPEQVRLGLDVELVYSPNRMDKMAADGLPKLEALGVQLHQLSMQREIGLHDFETVRGLSKLVKSRPPFDVLHGHSSKGGAFIRLFPTRAARVYTPNAFITMDPLLGERKKKLYAGIERVLAQRCEIIITVSDQERDHAYSIGLPKDKVRVVPSGIPPAVISDRATARQELNLSPNIPVIGFVARLSSQKAPETAVEAFCRIPKEARHGAKLVMVGYGPDLEKAQAVQSRYGETDIFWAGDRFAPALFVGFDVFFLSSRYESFGFVLIEAAHARCALVSTPVGIAENLIEDGKNGLLVPIDDVDAMAKALTRMLTDHEFRTRVQSAIAESAMQFTAETMTQKTIAVYEEAIKRRR